MCASLALCKGLRPLHPRTALARCPPSLAPLPGGMRTGQTAGAHWPWSLAPSQKLIREHWAIAGGAKGKRNGGGSLKKQDIREARMVARLLQAPHLCTSSILKGTMQLTNLHLLTAGCTHIQQHQPWWWLVSIEGVPSSDASADTSKAALRWH